MKEYSPVILKIIILVMKLFKFAWIMLSGLQVTAQRVQEVRLFKILAETLGFNNSAFKLITVGRHFAL